MEPVIQVRDLVKQYPGVRAVDGVSFEIPEGICFGLLGPNGAGKTTTVEIMEGVTAPTSGSVLYRGEPLGARFRAEAGIQFQKTALQDFLTVRETLVMFRRLYSHGRDVDDVIRLCALEQLVGRDNRKLSGGQLQRLLLGIALVNDPQVLFLDEPTTGLDPQARHNFWDLIRAIKAEGRTVLLTTHYMEEAYFLCDVIAIMDRGKIIAEGPPSRLLKEHFDDVVLELPREEFGIDPATFPLPVMLAGDRVEISTADVELALRALLDRGIPVRHLQIRPRNLEDLFLELTGRELRT
ncbi:MAG: ABC transporter ATP-binding protein [Gammaproteobacteria bacterium]|nr:ABC transporter ATP-binding protein [Gammaproteobacteria bacterium]